jgi:hypothetical protein
MMPAGGAYRLYGLTLHSPFDLPCSRAPRTSKPDVYLRPGSAAQFARVRDELRPSAAQNEWFEHRRLADGTRHVRWSGLFEFLISPDGREILFRRLEKGSPESFYVYLLGQVLSFSLLSLGVDPLHGTAMRIAGSAVAFLAPCGHGKSTLAAALLARGFPVIADDLLVLEERPLPRRWSVHSGIPRLKLFPSIARRVLGRNCGKTMNSGTSKLVLPLGPAEAVRRTTPLEAIYVLGDPAQVSSANARLPVQIEPLGGAEAFLELIRGAFNLLEVDSQRLAHQFTFARQLTADVPVRRLTYPRRLSMLPAVCDALLADLTSPPRPRNETACSPLRQSAAIRPRHTPAQLPPERKDVRI